MTVKGKGKLLRTSPLLLGEGFSPQEPYPKAFHKNVPLDYLKAKELRRDGAFAERLMWDALRRAGKGYRIKFRRQHPLHPYIADFVCLEARVVAEIDGDSHDLRQMRDAQRDRYLRKLGYEVLRFSNVDVYQDAQAVAQTIVERVKRRQGVVAAKAL